MRCSTHICQMKLSIHLLAWMIRSFYFQYIRLQFSRGRGKGSSREVTNLGVLSLHDQRKARGSEIKYDNSDYMANTWQWKWHVVLKMVSLRFMAFVYSTTMPEVEHISRIHKTHSRPCPSIFTDRKSLMKRWEAPKCRLEKLWWWRVGQHTSIENQQTGIQK